MANQQASTSSDQVGPQTDSATSKRKPVEQKELNTNERLSHAIGELSETTGAQTNEMKTMFDRLNTAVESLKQQPESTDKNTAFWNAYKTLADEFDKEFQRKYANDLDTSLLFAGLFSAVSSAFIIQIQPELQQDPNPVIQTNLLLILVQNVTGSAVSGIGPSPQPTVSNIVVVAQSLLYFSLFSTLLAALLAVLGKQWLLHYDSVGKRGTIEERGLERQRKCDGLQHWKFDLVMQVFPLLLQLSLLLFAVALSIYLWTIHHVPAAITLAMTSVGFILYTLMIISSIRSRDSPFQTSLNALLRLLIDMLPSVVAFSRSRLLNIWLACSGSKVTVPLIPQFRDAAMGPLPSPGPIFEDLDSPSDKVHAILWALETSTDPKLVESAAAMVPEWRLPVNLNLQPSLQRLANVFQGCFKSSSPWIVREDMDARATTCFKAFGILKMVTAQNEDPPDLLHFQQNNITSSNEELNSLVRFFPLSDFQSQPWKPVLITQWSLRFISAQNSSMRHLGSVLDNFQPDDDSLKDASLCADFLFCMNSFLCRTYPRDLSVLDKSEYTIPLLTLLFENISAAWSSLDPGTAGSIVQKVAQFYRFRGDLYFPGIEEECRNAVYSFCAIPFLSSETITLALQLVQIPLSWVPQLPPERKPRENVNWVYVALEDISRTQKHDLDSVGDLLQVLFLCRPVQSRPTATALRTLLWAMSAESEQTRIRYFALHMLCSVDHWFMDDEFRPILREGKAWQSLGTSLHKSLGWSSVPLYIDLGEQLSKTSEWKSIISQDLSGWMEGLTEVLSTDDEGTRRKFCSVLSRVWDTDIPVGAYKDEKLIHGPSRHSSMFGISSTFPTV
ncbi:hypothetical protein C8R43DRAFT_1230649 [Mycena crocata]|nr:hypothetical protein C8R43DRAFT_1230649 [Mycena crocata]